MHLEKIEIRGFGKLNSLSLNFGKGFNLIFGNNEAGKSTLQLFLKAMLYGLKGGRMGKDGTLPPLKNFRPWIGDEYAGFLEYRLDNGQSYRVGRNFAAGTVRVFDSLYNDITNTFEMSRDRGPLFAEKHLGMNEGCFERTAFIRQMDTRIDDSGSKELLNRLANVAQTGFEDVSFQKAQEALKEALKIRVGTDKTARRPMDLTLTKLEALKEEKKVCLEKKESLLAYEQGIKETIGFKEGLEDQRMFFLKAKEFLEKRQDFDYTLHIKKELEKNLERLNCIDEEKRGLSESVQEYKHIKEQLEPFSDFVNGCTDDIGVEYDRFANCLKDMERLKKELAYKEETLKQLQSELQPVRKFEVLERGVEERVSCLENDLENLQKEYENSSGILTDERINQVRFRLKTAKYNIFLGVILSAASAGVTYFSLSVGASLAGIFLFLTALAAWFTARFSKELTRLINEKSSGYISVNGLVGEIRRKQTELDKIFHSVDVRNTGDFFKQKAIFDNKTQESAKLKNEQAEMEKSLSACSGKAASLKDKILQTLIRAGIQKPKETEISEGGIRDFKLGMQKYQTLEPGIRFSIQRLEDLGREAEDLYRGASVLGGYHMQDKTGILLFLGGADQKLDTLRLELERTMEESRGLYLSAGMISPDLEFYLSQLREEEPEKVKRWLYTELDRLQTAMGETLLKVKEYETLLKAFGEDEDTIQRLDEEIYTQECTKKQLDDMNFALKTALDLLTEASLEIQRDFAPALNSRMSHFISVLTGGRYRDVRADDNLNLKVLAPETGDIVSAGILSGGTLDQMYLAMRLGMADLFVSGTESMPLVMDEVLAQYDDIRTGEALNFFKELSQETQILFFTCKCREVDIAREIWGDSLNLIELS